MEASGPRASSLSLLQVLYGESSFGEFGSAVSMSQNGNRLVVGSRSENQQTGAMRVYERKISSGSNSFLWALSDVISGQKPSERAGWAVSISADGGVIAMGSPKGGTEGGGSILTFRYNYVSSEWDPYGSMIQSLVGENAGYSISLSDTGSTLAVGLPKALNLDGESNAGKAAVYSMNGSDWELLGREVHGEAEGDVDGTSVAMSYDGSVAVIGGKGHSEVDASTGNVILQSTGHCRVYQFQSSEWKFQHSMKWQ